MNARHIKNVPGQKTDVQDSEWPCRLLRNRLVRGSLVPPQKIRELRDLTRYRRKLTGVISAEKNRVQKVLEDANIKLSSVVSNTFGVSGSDIVDALIKGELTVDISEYHISVYWIITFFTFSLLSVFCLYMGWEASQQELVIVVSVLTSISSIWNEYTLGKLIRGKNSYNANEEKWEKILKIKIPTTSDNTAQTTKIQT